MFYWRDVMRQEGEALRSTVSASVSDEPSSPLSWASADHCPVLPLWFVNAFNYKVCPECSYRLF